MSSPPPPPPSSPSSESGFGIAGTDPLQDFEKPLHVLLMDAVRAKWNDVADPEAGDPVASKINFIDTWFTDSRDMEIVFLGGPVNEPAARRSTDWKVIPTTEFVDIHVFARGKNPDVQPPHYHKLISMLERLIETKQNELVPPPYSVHVTVEGGRHVPEPDNLRNVWHYLCTAVARYVRVVKIVPEITKSVSETVSIAETVEAVVEEE